MTENKWRGDRVEFENFSEFLDFINAEDVEGMEPMGRQMSRAEKGNGAWHGTHWHGTPTWNDAMKIALKGWPEGVAKLEKVRAPMIEKLMPVILKPEVQYEVVGNGGLDMGRVMAGMPDPFMDFEDSGDPVYGSGRQLVRVVLNITASAGVDSDVIIARGAATAALVDALEAAGRRVSVVVGEGVTAFSSKDPLTQMILVKRPDAPLNIDTLVFAMAHPSMLRRFIFALNERHPDPDIRRRFGFYSGGTYGMPADFPPEERGDIYMGAMLYGDPNFETPRATQKWVVETLKKQGVILDEEALKGK